MFLKKLILQKKFSKNRIFSAKLRNKSELGYFYYFFVIFYSLLFIQKYIPGSIVYFVLLFRRSFTPFLFCKDSAILQEFWISYDICYKIRVKSHPLTRHLYSPVFIPARTIQQATQSCDLTFRFACALSWSCSKVIWCLFPCLHRYIL